MVFLSDAEFLCIASLHRKSLSQNILLLHSLARCNRCVIDSSLSALASKLIVSLVYSHDVVSRLSLGSVRDLRNAALWLCDANDEAEGYASVTKRARAWKAGSGGPGDQEWVCFSCPAIISMFH